MIATLGFNDEIPAQTLDFGREVFVKRIGIAFDTFRNAFYAQEEKVLVSQDLVTGVFTLADDPKNVYFPEFHRMGYFLSILNAPKDSRLSSNVDREDWWGLGLIDTSLNLPVYNREYNIGQSFKTIDLELKDYNGIPLEPEDNDFPVACYVYIEYEEMK